VKLSYAGASRRNQTGNPDEANQNFLRTYSATADLMRVTLSVASIHRTSGGRDMAVGNTSLRFQVEKLMGTTRGHTARVRLLERSRVGNVRRVCIQIERCDGSFSLFFFRHADHTWHVFPPEGRRLEMGTGLKAA
jgi:hypothetical protein